MYVAILTKWYVVLYGKDPQIKVCIGLARKKLLKPRRMGVLE